MATVYDFTFDQGTTIRRRLTWKRNGSPMDLTNWTARMEIRAKLKGELLFRLDTTNGRIVLGGPMGTIDLHITAEESTLWEFKSAVYDLELIEANGDVGRCIQGKVKVSQEVTTGA